MWLRLPLPVTRFRSRLHTLAQHPRGHSQPQRLQHDVARELHVPPATAAAAAAGQTATGEQQLLSSAGTAQAPDDQTATAASAATTSAAATAACAASTARDGGGSATATKTANAAPTAAATAAGAGAAAAAAPAVAPVPVQPVQRTRQSSVSRVGGPQDNAVAGRRLRGCSVAAAAQRRQPGRGHLVPNVTVPTSARRSTKPTGN